VVSLYWAVTTLTTMGYGDIGSRQTWEYHFSIVVMLMGGSCYAYIASNISIVLSSLDAEKAERVEHLEKLSHFMEHKRLSLPLRRRLRKYFNECTFASKLVLCL
jgi:voltage-gated potassium channel